MSNRIPFLYLRIEIVKMILEKPGQLSTTDWFQSKIQGFTIELEETIKSTRAITETDQSITLALSTHKQF